MAYFKIESTTRQRLLTAASFGHVRGNVIAIPHKGIGKRDRVIFDDDLSRTNVDRAKVAEGVDIWRNLSVQVGTNGATAPGEENLLSLRPVVDFDDACLSALFWSRRSCGFHNQQNKSLNVRCA